MARRRSKTALSLVLAAACYSSGWVFGIWACADVKPVARTVNDVARDLCAMFFSERQGISFDDAARGICATREVLDPFIREALRAQQIAGAAATPGAKDQP